MYNTTKNMTAGQLGQMFRGELPEQKVQVDELRKKDSRDVTLPNGLTYSNVPNSISKIDVLKRALKDGDITATEFKGLVSNTNDYKDILAPYELGDKIEAGAAGLAQGIKSIVGNAGKGMNDIMSMMPGDSNIFSERNSKIDEFINDPAMERYKLANPAAYTAGNLVATTAPFIASAPETIMGNIGLGAIQGFTQPAYSVSGRVTNTVRGGIIGGGVSTAMKGLAGAVAGISTALERKGIIAAQNAAKMDVNDKVNLFKTAESGLKSADDDLEAVKSALLTADKVIPDSAPEKAAAMGRLIKEYDSYASVLNTARKKKDIADEALGEAIENTTPLLNSPLEEALAAAGKATGIIKTKPLKYGDEFSGEYSPIEQAFYNKGASSIGKVGDVLTNPVVAPALGMMHSGPIGGLLGVGANMAKNALKTGELTPKYLQKLGAPRVSVPTLKVDPKNVLESAWKYDDSSKITNLSGPTVTTMNALFDQ